MNFDYSQIEVLKVEDIDFNDYPDFCNAFIAEAEYQGRPMTDEELDDLNMNHGMFVYEQVEKWTY